MKQLLTLIAFLSLTLAGFAQGPNSASYEDLMQRARRARTTSTIMVATGPVIAAGGIGTLIYGLIRNETDEGDFYYDINGNYVEVPPRKYTTEIVVGAAATVVGIGVALGSIAFSDKAYKLRREARKVKVSTSMDRIVIPGYQNGLGNAGVRQHKLSLIIPLGKG
jgi:hypothetical protein